jgi:hypothetical protein
MSVFIKLGKYFCKKVLRFPTSAANGTAIWEIGREGSRGILLHLAVKYYFEMMQMGQEIVRSRYEKQVENLNLGSWAVSLKEKLHKVCLGNM